MWVTVKYYLYALCCICHLTCLCPWKLALLLCLSFHMGRPHGQDLSRWQERLTLSLPVSVLSSKMIGDAMSLVFQGLSWTPNSTHKGGFRHGIDTSHLNLRPQPHSQEPTVSAPPLPWQLWWPPAPWFLFGHPHPDPHLPIPSLYCTP